MDYVIYFAITIGILVFVHEFGHFAAAKLSGMRADIFAIGFGKRLFGWNKINGFSFGELPKDFDGQGHTDYRLCLLPLGGYVKIAGMIDESFDADFADNEPKPYEFRSKSAWKKTFVITAGVLMNLLLALMIFWGKNFFQGEQIITTTKIGYVQPHTIIDSLGFKPGDKILSINNKPVENWSDIRNDIFINTLGQDVQVEVKRNGKLSEITIPRKNIPDNESKSLFLIPAGFQPEVGSVLNNSPAEKAGLKKGDLFLAIDDTTIYSMQQTIQIISSHKNEAIPFKLLRGKDTVQVAATPGADGKIGVELAQNSNAPIEFKSYGFFASFYYGWKDIARVTDLTFSMLGKVFEGKIAFGKAFGGPIKIAEFATQQANSGLPSFLVFLGLLSLSLAILNIMPFPVLDGGHLVIIIIEAVMKREIPVKVKYAIQQTGFVLLLLLMAFIIYNDLISL